MNPVLKKNSLIIGAAIVVAIVGAALIFFGSSAWFKRSNTMPLAQPPDHGALFVIEILPSEGQRTNSLVLLKNALLERADRVGLRIYWEPISESRVRVLAATGDQSNAQQLQNVFFRTGNLEFRLVHEASDRLIEAGEIVPGHEVLKRELRTPPLVEKVVVRKNPEAGLSGNVIKRTLVTRGNLGEPEVNFTLQPEASEAFAGVTRDNVGRRLAIVIDGELYSAPMIQSPIETGSGIITGDFDLARAFEIACVLEHPLPISVKVVEAKDY